MDIKENIVFVLHKRKMTQAELAKKMGVSPRNVQYYLKGNITLDTLQKMAIALDTTVETLVSEQPLFLKNDPVPNRSTMTTTTLICPHCGQEFSLIAKQ